MHKKLDKSDEILARLQKEGKVTEIPTKEYLAEMQRMNEYMEEVEKDFRRKDALSNLAASRSILTD